MRCAGALILLVVATATLPGCAMSHTMSSMLPMNGVSRDDTESSDPWIMEAADEGRREIPSESANDPLHLRRYFMSQKARDIERNVGIRE